MGTITTLLEDAVSRLSNSSDSAALDAEILLCLSLEKPRSYLRAWPDRKPEPQQIRRFQALLRQRLQGAPIAYLTGRREFWSREFRVTPAVLIPRPETELLIEISLALLPHDRPAKIIDLGTGSGIIAVTLAKELPQTEVIATDFSQAALEIAKYNAEQHGAAHIRFLHSDWFTSVPSAAFDLVVSNPPYIAENDVHLGQGDVRFEPRSALTAPSQGLADIRTIAGEARRYLRTGGHLLIEHGYDQESAAQAIFRDAGYDQVQTYKDLSGQPRATYGRNRAS
ncbi:peptide chain release factor N(5)-glutamine methyltransferase [Candidatus Methylomicrobium oryzae]|jgi:release factor glutamine methyltransferase|uniref:peptide chain release factor N(5)-glutamine methyltransferase n=1 Tax=Candidatus Methylomicrobium oryzae TaxID=2802053 RepID=UPI0019220C2D|nr:peptide chain release factor N(5)-glutamine methyltransferase [Methylomicrobium sp. RS1]MBL1262131.1 peptide chain release factor N(5)-glutamine methyltransferase [Methylomicrobium sp. RS1]